MLILFPSCNSTEHCFISSKPLLQISSTHISWPIKEVSLSRNLGTGYISAALLTNHAVAGTRMLERSRGAAPETVSKRPSSCSTKPPPPRRLAPAPCAASRRRPSPPEVHRRGRRAPALPPLPSFCSSLSPPHLRSSLSLEPQQAMEEPSRRRRPSDLPEPPVVDPIRLPSARSTPAPPEPTPWRCRRRPARLQSSIYLRSGCVFSPWIREAMY